MTRSSPWRLGLAAAMVALAGAACSAAPPSPAPRPPVAVDPAAIVRWATSELDPCTLLSPDVVDAVEGAGPVYAASPHSCAIVGTVTVAAADPASDTGGRILVSVGTAFGTAERAAASPSVLGGRLAYLTRDVPAGPRAVCAVDFPISPTRSVRVAAPAGEGDLATACRAATVIAEPIGPKIAAPAERAGPAVVGDLRRWGACDLLAEGLGWQPDRGPFAAPDADTCRGNPRGPGSEPSVQLAMSTGPAALAPPGTGEEIVQLPGGAALQAGTPAQCTLTTIAQALPGAPVDAAAHRLTVVLREAGDDPCVAAADVLGKLTAAVANGPGTGAPAPATMGYPPGTTVGVPDACGVPGTALPGTCRAPQPAEVPPDVTALVRGAGTPAGADVACAMLAAVAAPGTGELERAAADGTGCIGLAADGYAVTVGFAERTGAAAADRCVGGGDSRPEVPLPGRTGMRCPSSPDTFDLVVPVLGDTLADDGAILRITGQALPPRGDRTRARPADAQERVTARTRGLADALVSRYLGPA
ncbi:MAG: hypothetical protein L0H84_16060 [Pseudonocardia sp.]|nr:hypothetical protein [Pseudonocardia sp.]